MQPTNITSDEQAKPQISRSSIDWPSYDRALKRRGSLTLWFCDTLVDAWHPARGGKRGGQRRYSDLAIETTLTIRLVYQQALRQAEGLVESIVNLMGIDIDVPDHTTLSRRCGSVSVAPLKRRSGEAVNLIIDSSGLKVYGQGEWDAAKHGLKKRRRWRKLHLGIDEASLEILSHTLTTEDVGDSTEVANLLDQVDNEVDELMGDGAYDAQNVYDSVEGHAAGGRRRVTIPPRSNATLSSQAEVAPTQRDRHVRFVQTHGRKAWESHVGYSRRLLVENGIYRYKTIIGRQLRARELSAQRTEAELGCKILNRMARLGLPRRSKSL